MQWTKWKAGFLITIVVVISFAMVLTILADSWQKSFLPSIFGSPDEMQEVRALWVTRYNWTSYAYGDPARIDEIVNNAAAAGFNTLYFQVRGEADAYYASQHEPWARRLTGTLGKDPGWDPLQRLVERAHAAGLQVHAYINVYPLWAGCEPPPDNTTPRHLYYTLRDAHGETDDNLNGVQWTTDGEPICSNSYVRVSPASIPFDDHLRSVVTDLVQNYNIDGVHLDHIRYAGPNTSCDPVSEERFEDECFAPDSDYEDWQRRQVNGTVEKLYKDLRDQNPDLWLSAAVWPVYRDVYGWRVNSGYDSYYQDAKAWLNGSYIDSVSPMIYTGNPNCDRPYFWTQDKWETLVNEYQAVSNGRFIVPGIGVQYCTDDDFAEIAARIELARTSGAAGHAIFSYGGLQSAGYFDDLASGPYRVPAKVPLKAWH